MSKTHLGSAHDFTLYKQEAPAARGARAYADAGCQGRQDLHIKTELPHKKSKKKGLDVDKKEHHRALSRFLVKVEKVLGRIKVFKSTAQRYRHKGKPYKIKFQMIAGILNLKNGFALA